MRPRKKKVVLGLTAGTPGKVAAALLKNQDFDVKCVHLAVRPELRGGERAFFQTSDEAGLKKFCQSLDIALVYRDVSDRFESDVLDPAVHARVAGRVSDARLNWVSKVLLAELEAIRRESKYDLIATGHPIQMVIDQGSGLPMVSLGAKWAEDESPLIAHVDIETLKHALFPIGELTPAMVRKIALELKIETAPETSEAEDDEEEVQTRPPLQWEGFAGDLWQGEWAHHRVSPGLRNPGLVRSTDQLQMGDHEGILGYRVGDRAESAGNFIVSIQPHPGRVLVVGPPPALEQKKFLLKGARFIGESSLSLRTESFTVLCGPKTQRTAAHVLRYMGDFLSLECETPLIGVASGQTAVFFKGNHWVGSALFV